MDKTRIAIIPGNGEGDIECCNWYAWVRDKLNENPKIEAVLSNMPDPLYARESIWLPFMRNELKCDENTIIVGHSSGAAAAMRFAETYKVRGIILVSAYISDLGSDLEQESGYFNRAWEWAKIKENCGYIAQFASSDDPFLPWEEQMVVAKSLQCELKSYTNKGHFMSMSFPDLVKLVNEIVK